MFLYKTKVWFHFNIVELLNSCIPLSELAQLQSRRISFGFVREAFESPHTVCIPDTQSRTLDSPRWTPIVKIPWITLYHLKKIQRTNLNNVFSTIYIFVKIMTFFHFFQSAHQVGILIDLYGHIPLSLRRLSKDLLHFWTWSGVGRLNTEELWHSPPIAVSVFLRRRNWNFFFIFFALKRQKKKIRN